MGLPSHKNAEVWAVNKYPPGKMFCGYNTSKMLLLGFASLLWDFSAILHKLTSYFIFAFQNLDSNITIRVYLRYMYMHVNKIRKTRPSANFKKGMGRERFIFSECLIWKGDFRVGRWCGERRQKLKTRGSGGKGGPLFDRSCQLSASGVERVCLCPPKTSAVCCLLPVGQCEPRECCESHPMRLPSEALFKSVVSFLHPNNDSAGRGAEQAMGSIKGNLKQNAAGREGEATALEDTAEKKHASPP